MNLGVVHQKGRELETVFRPAHDSGLMTLLVVAMLSMAGCFPHSTEWEPLGSNYSLRRTYGMGPIGSFSSYALYHKNGWRQVLVCDRPDGHYFRNDPRKPISWMVFNTNLLYVESFQIRVSPRKEDRFHFKEHEELKVHSPRTGFHVLVPNYQDYAETKIENGKIILLPYTAAELVQDRERRTRGLEKLPPLEFSIKDIGDM